MLFQTLALPALLQFETLTLGGVNSVRAIDLGTW